MTSNLKELALDLKAAASNLKNGGIGTRTKLKVWKIAELISEILKDSDNLDIISIRERLKSLTARNEGLGSHNAEQYINLSNELINNLNEVALGKTKKSFSIDVLIITAVKDELEAVFKLENGSQNDWETSFDSSNFMYFSREFLKEDGTPFTVAVARSTDMGETPAATVTSRLISELNPHCLAMCGVCAGAEGEVFFGDVIVADRVFKSDFGKHKVHIGKDGTPKEEFFPDNKTYNLSSNWKQLAEHTPDNWNVNLLKKRPISLQSQEDWLLEKLFKNLDYNIEVKKRCPDWPKVIKNLREKKYIKKELELTEKGRKYIQEKVFLYPKSIPGDPPFKVHVGPLATVSAVEEDPEIFDKLKAKHTRKILGLDMESYAIGFVAEAEKINNVIIAKAVQDYAFKKGDLYRKFAATASAEFLLYFFKKYLPIRDSEKKNSQL